MHRNDNIQGLTDYDLPELTIRCVRLFRQQDKKIIQTGQPSKIIDIYLHDDNSWKAYLFTKHPLINKNQTIDGIIFHGQEITDVLRVELGSMLLQNTMTNYPNYSIDATKYILAKKMDIPKLTNRQADVLFYLLRGQTIKQAAKSLNISLRTAEDHLQQLKEKFATPTKHDLIEKSLSLGYLSAIPAFLFTNQLLLEI